MKDHGLSQLGRRTKEPPISWLMHATLARPNLISLAAGFTDNDTLPVSESLHLLQDLLGRRKTGEPALQYGTTVGLPDLRELTAQRLKQLDGTAAGNPRRYSADRALITHGSQQLLYMIAEVLCDPGDIVLVEDPTYFVFLGIMQSHGVRARGLRMESDGIDVGRLRQVLERLDREGELPRVKMLYLVSYSQNPTGRTTSLEKKTAALDVLRHYERKAGHPIYLLEDAAYRELGFSRNDVPSTLTAPGADDRAIYAGTYSKPFATGVRIGFGFLPDPILRATIRVKANHDFGTASLNQHLLARALRTGQYERHLVKLRRRYARKADAMMRGMRAHFPKNVRYEAPTGGMYVWAALPHSVKTGLKSPFFQRALSEDVLYVPGELCYANDPTRRKPRHETRLSFGNASLEEIEEGIARLGRVLDEVL